SGERQTAQSQPSIGTPTEVPVPRKVKVRVPGMASRGAGRAATTVWTLYRKAPRRSDDAPRRREQQRRDAQRRWRQSTAPTAPTRRTPGWGERAPAAETEYPPGAARRGPAGP